MMNFQKTTSIILRKTTSIILRETTSIILREMYFVKFQNHKHILNIFDMYKHIYIYTCMYSRHC